MLLCKRRVTTQCSNTVDKQKYDILRVHVILRRLEKKSQGQCERIGRYMLGFGKTGVEPERGGERGKSS